MLSPASLFLLTLAASSVFGLVVPRSATSAGQTTNVGDYQMYHSLGCHTSHDTAYTDKCCGPLRKDESWHDRIVHCVPSASTTAPADSSDEKKEGSEDYETGDDHYPSEAPSEDHTYPDNNEPRDTNQAGGWVTGGYATYFFQNGNAGACGNYNSDGALIAAMDYRRYGDTGAVSKLCGNQVEIINTENGKSVVVTVADACPTCSNSNSIDLSAGAYDKIASRAEGIVPIRWKYL